MGLSADKYAVDDDLSGLFSLSRRPVKSGQRAIERASGVIVSGGPSTTKSSHRLSRRSQVVHAEPSRSIAVESTEQVTRSTPRRKRVISQCQTAELSVTGQPRKRQRADDHGVLLETPLRPDADTVNANDVEYANSDTESGMVSQPQSEVNSEVESDVISEGLHLVHETLQTATSTFVDQDKDDRTVFLGNIANEAITSRTARKTLIRHIVAAIDRSLPSPQRLETLRFRSIPFSTAGIPKRAAYITKSVMPATTKSCNAYAVFSDVVSAQQAVKILNGTVVLGRHLRVDSATRPATTDHRRCVFVGNLPFVDDAGPQDGQLDSHNGNSERQRHKSGPPHDVEEGLWMAFTAEAGRVESVRVVRDQATRVGKGFAYVQFYDENAVEAALLMSGKKFPPMLPRKLRVSRCWSSKQTSKSKPLPRVLNTPATASDVGVNTASKMGKRAHGLGRILEPRGTLHRQRERASTTRSEAFEGLRAKKSANPRQAANRRKGAAKRHHVRATHATQRAAEWRRREPPRKG